MNKWGVVGMYVACEPSVALHDCGLRWINEEAATRRALRRRHTSGWCGDCGGAACLVLSLPMARQLSAASWHCRGLILVAVKP